MRCGRLARALRGICRRPVTARPYVTACAVCLTAACWENDRVCKVARTSVTESRQVRA